MSDGKADFGLYLQILELFRENGVDCPPCAAKTLTKYRDIIALSELEDGKEEWVKKCIQNRKGKEGVSDADFDAWSKDKQAGWYATCNGAYKQIKEKEIDKGLMKEVKELSETYDKCVSRVKRDLSKMNLTTEELETRVKNVCCKSDSRMNNFDTIFENT